MRPRPQVCPISMGQGLGRVLGHGPICLVAGHIAGILSELKVPDGAGAISKTRQAGPG